MILKLKFNINQLFNIDLLCHTPLVVLIMKLNISMVVYLNTYISIIQYLFVIYYLTFVVLISSEDLVTNINPTYNLHTEFLFLKFKYYLLIFLLKCYFFPLPHYALIALMLIPLLIQDTASTIGGSLGQKVSIVQPLLST